MQLPGGGRDVEKSVLTMRGGINHDHHGTRVSRKSGPYEKKDLNGIADHDRRHLLLPHLL